jgi:N-acyl-D-amino-acid deacylase
VGRLLIADGRVVDGTGAPARPGSVLIRDDRVEAILAPGQPEPKVGRRIDAGGRVIAPGFVDVHEHSDMTPFVEPGMDSMLRQGVTTVVVGNCGGSAFPFEGAREHAAMAGSDVQDLALAPWTSFGGYLEAVERARPALNVAALVGHGTLREAVMGRAARPPARDELGRMRDMLAAAMDEGALGLSSGLIYVPGLHATTDELVEVARGLAGRGVYASHVRGEGATVFAAVAECIEVGTRAGVPAHVSHLKVEGPTMWGRGGELLELLDRARAEGADVSADQYPYTAWETTLAAALPPWAAPEELPAILADAPARERLRTCVEEGEPGWESVGRDLGWDRIVVGSHVPDPDLTGRSIAAIALERRLEPWEAIALLLVGDPYTGMIGHGMDERDVRTIVARPEVFVASDALAVSPSGPLGAFAVHPRYYGTFARVLGRYVREEGLLTLEDAVRKMTSLPAERFGLAGRGRIAPGAFADVVMLDADRVLDAATYERPHAFAEGVEVVVVNGRVAWDGRPGARAGRALLRGER